MKFNIKEAREKLGLTQSELAYILGLSSQVRIAEYENGTRNPSLSVKILLTLIIRKPNMIKTIKKIRKEWELK